MSKRIEDVMYRAGLTAQGCWDELDEYAKQAIETFAQLLIEECVQVADQCREDEWFDVSGAITEHFEK